MEQKNIWDMFAAGELPVMEFGLTNDTYYKMAFMLVFSFVVIILVGAIAYKNAKC